MTADASLRRIDQTLDYLHSVARAQVGRSAPDFDRLLDAYLEARGSLAREFRELAQELLPNARSRLVVVKSQIEERMAHRFGAVVPARLLTVRGYAGVHGILLDYLASQVGRPVTASRLRVLAGDQTHTERRVRELRDLGFDVSWKKVASEDQYVLGSVQPDLDEAAKVQLALNLRAAKSLPHASRTVWLSLTDPTGS